MGCVVLEAVSRGYCQMTVITCAVSKHIHGRLLCRLTVTSLDICIFQRALRESNAFPR